MTINVDAAPDSTEINPTTPIMTTTTPATTDVATLADWVKSAQFNDPEFQKIVRRLEAIAETGPQAPGDAAFAQHYAIRDGHLWRGTKTPLLWVPPAAQTLVIHQFHDAPDVCHLSQEETARAIRTQYTWPALSADVRQHVRACPVCVTKRGPIKARAHLQDGPPKKSSRRGRKTRPNKPSAPTTPGKSNNPGRLQRREPAHAEYVACAPQQRPPNRPGRPHPRSRPERPPNQGQQPPSRNRRRRRRRPRKTTLGSNSRVRSEETPKKRGREPQGQIVSIL
jgi:hypothetical protein